MARSTASPPSHQTTEFRKARMSLDHRIGVAGDEQREGVARART